MSGKAMVSQVEHVEVALDRSLAELTALLGAACDRVEEIGAGAVLVLWLGQQAAVRWPDASVGVHEVNKWERALRRVERLNAPVIAVAQGECSGPALETLLVADHRIVSSSLRMVPPVNEGLFWPSMAVHRLVDQLGAGRARQVVLRGAVITAARAEQIGLVDEIADDLAGALDVAVSSLGQVSGVELAVRRRLLNEAATTSFEDALGPHLAACDRELLRVRRETELVAQWT